MNGKQIWQIIAISIAVLSVIEAFTFQYLLKVERAKPECVITEIEKSVDFYYSPECGHCQSVKPLVDSLRQENQQWKWTYHNVMEEQTDALSVPTIRIRTSDNRRIELVGSVEIPKWLECELKEQSSEECPTYKDNYNDETNSWFIRN